MSSLTITAAGLIPYALALLVAAATPGPSVTAIVASGIARGFPMAAAMALGVVVGDVFWVEVVIAGLALLAQQLGPVFLVVKYAGAAYLIWLGIKLWRAPPSAPEAAPVINAQSLGREFAVGAGLSLANPKAILFHAGVMPALLDLEHATLADAVVIGLLAMTVVGAVHLSYAGLASRAREALSDPRVLVWVFRTAGTVLIATALVIALS
jgi:threonine/homoserine/homoserine lactone efflux protein